MSRSIALVAWREFRQILASKGFWISLLFLPVALAAGPLIQRLAGPEDGPERIMIIDHAGQAPGIAERIELSYQRRVLDSLSRHVERYGLEHAAPDAIWTRHDLLFNDSQVRRFISEGGAEAARRKLAAASPQMPSFEAPPRLLTVVWTPPAIAEAPREQLDALLGPLLDASRGGSVDHILYIPPDFARGGSQVRLWTGGNPDRRVMSAIEAALGTSLRRSILAQEGVSSSVATIAATAQPTVLVARPRLGEGSEGRIIRSMLPLAGAYMLLVVLMLSGSWLLQSMIEERSNKLMESVLACVSPEELMRGKLIGTAAVAFFMVAVWIGCAALALMAVQDTAGALLRPMLAPYRSPAMLAAIGFYFVAGYLMVAMIFLVIGALSESMRDAQAYLTPIVLLLTLPVLLLVNSIVQGTTGWGISFMTWFPLYTPFAMLARIGMGVTPTEILGTVALLIAFISLEWMALGRLFRRNLLRAGGGPNLFVRLLRRART